MTRAEADNRARELCRYWIGLASLLTWWAIRRTSMFGLVYAGIADVAALRQLAAVYRASGVSLTVAVFAAPATVLRWLAMDATTSLPWPVAVVVTVAAHALLATGATHAMRVRGRVP